MQLEKHPIEMVRRFTCINTSKPSDEELTSEQIALQIAEFEQRGGTIKIIPTGVNALANGVVIVSEEPHSMAVPRNSKRNNKTVTAANSPFITVQEAAQLSGKSASYINKCVTQGKLHASKQEGCRAFFLKRTELLAFINKSKKGDK